jgi:hypothetical protein
MAAGKNIDKQRSHPPVTHVKDESQLFCTSHISKLTCSSLNIHVVPVYILKFGYPIFRDSFQARQASDPAATG